VRIIYKAASSSSRWRLKEKGEYDGKTRKKANKQETKLINSIYNTFRIFRKIRVYVAEISNQWFQPKS
jgi:hypothetical protein